MFGHQACFQQALGFLSAGMSHAWGHVCPCDELASQVGWNECLIWWNYRENLVCWGAGDLPVSVPGYHSYKSRGGSMDSGLWFLFSSWIDTRQRVSFDILGARPVQECEIKPVKERSPPALAVFRYLRFVWSVNIVKG